MNIYVSIIFYILITFCINSNILSFSRTCHSNFYSSFIFNIFCRCRCWINSCWTSFFRSYFPCCFICNITVIRINSCWSCFFCSYISRIFNCRICYSINSRWSCSRSCYFSTSSITYYTAICQYSNWWSSRSCYFPSTTICQCWTFFSINCDRTVICSWYYIIICHFWSIGINSYSPVFSW